MTETFLILLSSGILLSAAVSDPKQVTLHWLRLCGILALSLLALAGFFFFRRDEPATAPQLTLLALSLTAVLGQLAFVQIARQGAQRAFSALAAALLLALAAAVFPRGAGPGVLPLAAAGASFEARAGLWLGCAGVAATAGLALMDMLLGHAYLTASRMTMRPFARLNLALAVALVARAAVAGGVVFWLQARRPAPKLWAVYGLFVATRWLVGLMVPAAFVYMAHDCIRRRATQSATGILYVAGVLIFIGEIIALYLVRQTGLPF